MRADKFPALQVGQVREDIVGVHGGLADDDVGGEEQGQLLGIGEDLDEFVPRRQGIDRRSHVEHERLDGIGVGVADAGDDLLVDVAGKRIPGALGRIALEDGALVVLGPVPDDGDAEGLDLAALLGDIEGLAFFVARNVKGGGLGQARPSSRGCR